ncbi:trihelix transcription factor GT-3b-like [Populus nigra]|uniref:trihelix transcription factor GT-3b-like n=1 Tax=Populus nigra TaxID=3691 RepID=UPI002B26A591|nr:trihelix transcription factor GT-3b-like [Populus nigra]
MMFSGGGEGDGLGRINMMPTAAMLSPTAEISPRGPPQQQPQWGQQETKEFIGIRAELEKDFTVTKRNKTLWEIVSAKMREKGYRRTPEQCKCKWKNLVNRYKGKETSDPETGRQCPFFEELHAVFTERAKNMQRLLLESEAGSTQSRKKMKRTSGDRSSDEFSEEEDEDEDDSEEEKPVRSNSRKRKVEKIIAEKSPRASSSTVGGIQEMLKELLQQQQKMEMQWREMMERRSHERQMFEQEWRQSMEKLERERLMIEQAWREREEQRRIREESRAERRDALLTTLLNKLIRENNI